MTRDRSPKAFVLRRVRRDGVDLLLHHRDSSLDPLSERIDRRQDLGLVVAAHRLAILSTHLPITRRGQFMSEARTSTVDRVAKFWITVKRRTCFRMKRREAVTWA